MNDFRILANQLRSSGAAIEWRGDFLIATVPWGKISESKLIPKPGHVRYFKRDRIEILWHVPDWWDKASFLREWGKNKEH